MGGAARSSDDAVRFEAAFEPLGGRRCYVARWRAGAPRASAVLVQPFGDEAHLARRTQRRIAERLAAIGVDVRLADPSCTGDSDGEFEHASLAQWRRELAGLESAALAEVPGPCVLVGGRFGAWLALDRLGSDETRAHGAVLWSPIADGRAQLTHYLRLLGAVAAAGDGPRPAERARADWAAGRGVAIAGLDFGAAFAGELEAAVAPVPVPDRRVVVVELRDLPEDAALEPTPGAARVAAAWTAAGSRWTVEPVRGAPFWNVPDPVDCDALVDAVVEAVDRCLR